MSRAGKRLRIAENAVEPDARPAPRRWHRIIQRVGQSFEEALAEYGAERIGTDDGIIVRVLVLPKHPFGAADGRGGEARAGA
jgi:hypothetical protein